MNKSELFTGHSSEMKSDSPWLSSEDLLGRGDIKCRIKACHRHKDVEFDAGRKVPTVYSVEFEGKKKQLVLNSVNRKTLVSKYGANVQDWAGKDVVLYVDENVRLMGKTVCGVRIK